VPGLARVEKQGAFSPPNTWRVVVHGWRIVIFDESYAVACAVADALNHPERWEPTEAYEIADYVRRTLAPRPAVSDAEKANLKTKPRI
jgi:hypothetical protein